MSLDETSRRRLELAVAVLGTCVYLFSVNSPDITRAIRAATGLSRGGYYLTFHVPVALAFAWSYVRLRDKTPRPSRKALALGLGWAVIALVDKHGLPLLRIYMVPELRPACVDYVSTAPAYVFDICVVIPIIEEYIFRIYLQSFAAKYVSAWLYIPAVAFLFTLIHDYDWAGRLDVFVTAIFFGLVWKFSRSPVLNIATHASVNFITVLWLFGAHRWLGFPICS